VDDARKSSALFTPGAHSMSAYDDTTLASLGSGHQDAPQAVGGITHAIAHNSVDLTVPV
jgi:hypothetical protein